MLSGSCAFAKLLALSSRPQISTMRSSLVELPVIMMSLPDDGMTLKISHIKPSSHIQPSSNDYPILKVSRVILPFTFEVQTSNNQLASYAITLLQKVDNLILDKLSFEPLTTQDTTHDRPELHRIIKVQKDLHEILTSLATNYLFIKLQRQLTDKEQQFGILYHIQKSFFGILRLPSGIKLRDIISDGGLPLSSITTSTDLSRIQINVEPTTEMETSLDHSLDHFSMAPPSESLLKPSSTVLHSPKAGDPLTFLYSRYFSTLYSLTTPLNYFPKTALTRFKIMCDNEDEKMSTNLQKLFLPVDEMDNRHLGKYGILKTSDGAYESYEGTNLNLAKEKSELEFQNEFLNKNIALMNRIRAKENKDPELRDKFSISDEEKLQVFVLELKLREAQLQVLIILELLSSWKISEQEFLSANLKRQEKELKRKNRESKQSLVRKKKSKPKKIIPTFLGMGVNVADTPAMKSPKHLNVDQFAVYISLNTMLDRMTLWDTLLGKNLGENDKTYNFLAYVLVPFYNKKLPIIIKYMVDKIKEVNMKLTTKTEKRAKLSPKPEDSESTNVPPKRSKYNKVLLSGTKVPHLRKSASTSIKDDLLPSFVLKRSNSNLSARHLEKREVDMSMKAVPKPQRSKSLNQKLKSFSEKATNSFIFGNIKKTKTQPAVVPSLPQIQATPAKKRIIDISSIPMNKSESVPLPDISSNSFSQIESTPFKKRQIDYSDVMKTPEDNYTKPNEVMVPSSEVRLGVSEKLMNLTRQNVTLAEDQTQQMSFTGPPTLTGNSLTIPANDSVFSSPFNKEGPFPPQQTPKENVINSSPERSIRRRTRPGEPVSVAESPFYNPHINGSPPSNVFQKTPNINEEVQTDNDSDYDMLKSKEIFKSGRVYSRNRSKVDKY